MQQVSAGKKGNAPETNDRFFGGDYWRNANNSKELYKMFKQKILNYRSEIKEFNIIATNTIEKYKLVVCTKRTSGGNPWLANFEKEIKKRTDGQTGKSIEGMLERKKGLTTSLSDYERF